MADITHETFDYCPPVTVVEQLCNQLRQDVERAVCAAVLEVGIEVDKEELIKALNYDRGQYEKGETAGWNKGFQEGYLRAWSDADVDRLREDLRSLRTRLNAAKTQLHKSTDCEYCIHSKLPLPNVACSLCSPEHDMWKWVGVQDDEMC